MVFDDDEDNVTVPTLGFGPYELGERAYTLSIVEGPDAGASLTLTEQDCSRILVGQSDACDVKLADANASRRHACFEVVEIGLRVTDLGSTNGTYVDRVRVVEAILSGGETVRVGSTSFRIESTREAGKAPIELANGFGGLVGQSPQMRRLYPLCRRLAASDVPVVIEGETGTGKEVLAEALHEEGTRGNGPFVVFDCTAVPPSLLESELFGHERGAFTGATATRRGVFEQASGGTLLIDEIGDLDLALQPKLLRAIERSEIRRVGGDRWISVDVRIIAATRRNLDREIQAGRFRDDLFHRIAVCRIELPPLRDRRKDIPILVRHFYERANADWRGLRADLLARWVDAPWLGNVRELRNAVARHIALGDAYVPNPVTPPPDAPQTFDRFLAMPFTEARDRVLEAFEEAYVEQMLARHAGDLARAAATSGIGVRYFQKLRARTRK
jgi:two-component system, NtrC family, response regulator HydG